MGLDMKTEMEKQLDKIENLVERVVGYSDKIEKKKAFESILSRINTLIPDTIHNNFQEIQAYDKFLFQNFTICKYYNPGDDIDSLLIFVSRNIKAIQIFENDSKELQNERLSKHNDLRQMSFPRNRVIKVVRHVGVNQYDEKITEEDPDWIYSQYGTYTQYLSFKTYRYFPICRNIIRSCTTNFETVNYLVLLYIAVNNELKNINEELEILGFTQTFSTIQHTETELTNKNTNIGKPKLKINAEKFKPYFKHKFFVKTKDEIPFNKMVSQLSVIDNTINKICPKDYGTIALLIYDSGFLEIKNSKKITFEDWKTVFCECVGIELFKYKPNALTKPKEEIKTLFNYLIPKKY
jgi:hypothetical protein